MNSLDSKFFCPICDRESHVNVGPQLFEANTWAPVCADCGDEHAPNLAALLDLAACAAAFSLHNQESRQQLPAHH